MSYFFNYVDSIISYALGSVKARFIHTPEIHCVEVPCTDDPDFDIIEHDKQFFGLRKNIREFVEGDIDNYTLLNVVFARCATFAEQEPDPEVRATPGEFIEEMFEHINKQGRSVTLHFEEQGTTLMHMSANCLPLFKKINTIYKNRHLNILDNNLATPLHNALSTGSFDVAHYIIELGGDINAQDRFGRSALHQAVHDHSNIETKKRDKTQITAHLIESGIRLDLVDNEGRAAKQLAYELGKDDLAKEIPQTMVEKLNQTKLSAGYCIIV